MRSNGSTRIASLAAALAILGGLLAGCGGSGGSSNAGAAHSKRSSKPAAGGSLHVLEGSGSFAWHSLDPALGTGFEAFPFYMDAIYGNLFEQGPDNQPVPDLATGYRISNGGRTVTITLRQGVTFTDGTPFNAAAVKFNLDRDFAPSTGNACACNQDFPVASIDTPDDHTVVLNLTKPFGPIVEAFYVHPPNWIVSPTALQKEGAKQFALAPVGAGPFMVKSNSVGTTLQLVKNPHYWAKGKPYLDSLTFSTIGSDESALEALRAGQAQTYQNLGTLALVSTARKQGLTVQPGPAVNPFGVQLNTAKPPFNNLLAREAIYYATDPEAINTSVLLGMASVTETGTGPDGLFYEPTVPGYRTYDLAKAKRLVKQLGGLDISILTTAGESFTQVMTALQSEWSKAGIHATLNQQSLGVMIQQFEQGGWTAALQTLGGFDPALGFGLSFRFLSSAPFSGVHDPALDKLIEEGAAETGQAARAATYRQVFKTISDKAYAPFLFAIPVYNVSVHGVTAPGLTSKAPEVLWEDARVAG